MSNNISNSNIVEFFRNSTVFLTGGTGFLGKVLTSKLLLDCQVSRIYLLLRKKTSKSRADRIRQLKKDAVYVKIRQELPEFRDRIKFIDGDLMLENLGISQEDEETLRESVNFVINCAAAMDMLGPFKKSVTINIRGTRELVAFSNKMTNLKAFVHLSTLSAFWENEVIEEKLYRTHLEYEDCLKLLKLDHIVSMDKQNADKIVGKKQTMYALTKAASENIFIRENISVPVIIFRLTMAIPCWKEPIPGWANDFWGPSGMFALNFAGITPVLYWKGSTSSKIDIVPGDLVANAIIATIPYSYDKYQKSKENDEDLSPYVYNYTSINHKNCLTYKDAFAYSKKEFYKAPIIVSCKTTFFLWNLLLGFFPTLSLDMVAFLLGKNYTFSKSYRDIVKLNYKLTAYSHLKTRINDENVQNCWKNLNHTDKKLFSFDLSDVDWEEYAPRGAKYTRKYTNHMLEKHESLRLAIFWIPAIRFILLAVYFTIIIFFFFFVFPRIIRFLSGLF